MHRGKFREAPRSARDDGGRNDICRASHQKENPSP